jgi:hypothetical protein
MTKISYKRDNSRFPMLIVSVSLFVAITLLVSFVSFVGAQPEPSVHRNNKITIEEVPGQELITIESIDTISPGPNWLPLFVEDFESANWEDKWDVNLDIGSAGTGLKWGSQAIVNSLDPSSSKSGWGICAEDSCSNVDPNAPSYPAGVQSFLVAGPLDLSDSKDALVKLDLFYEANTNDKFTISVSENRYSYIVVSTVTGNIDDGRWQEKTVSLSDYVGKDQIWIAFTFESAASASKFGAMIDNISIWHVADQYTYIPVISSSGNIVKIVSILYSPVGSDVDGEYVQLQNQGAAFNMQGWQLHDEANTTYTFPNFTLAEGAQVRVWTGAGTNDNNDLYWNSGWAIWNNAGDTATLKNKSGQTVDTCTYTGGGTIATCP